MKRKRPWRPAVPPQPRHPRLAALLRAQHCRNRVKEKRKARRILIAAGIDPTVLS